MNSRYDKYYDNNNSLGSRQSRNSELYKEISKTDLNSFDVRSNATVIGDSQNNIDIDKIKSILDTHYNETPKRRTIKLEDLPKEKETSRVFETKEYDINVVLDKAKEEKIESYEQQRASKLRNTQFDILKSLSEDSIEEEQEEAGDKTLQDLINTITINEKDAKDKSKTLVTEPLDLFEDLKGTENTAVLEPVSEEAGLTKTQSIVDSKTTSVDTSFFTSAETFSKKDFEDFKDIEDEKGSKAGVVIIIILLVLAILVGGFFLVKTFFF